MLNIFNLNRGIVSWRALKHAPKIKELFGEAQHQAYIEAVLKNCNPMAIRLNSSSVNQWFMDGQHEALAKLAWKDVQPHIRSCRVLFDDVETDWNGDYALSLLEIYIRDAAKVKDVEICLRYSDGFLEDRKEDEEAKAMWLYGQKSNARRIAQTLWQIT